MNLQCLSLWTSPYGTVKVQLRLRSPESSRDGGVGAKVDTDDRVPRRNAIETLNSTQMIPLSPFASLFLSAWEKHPLKSILISGYF